MSVIVHTLLHRTSFYSLIKLDQFSIKFNRKVTKATFQFNSSNKFKKVLLKI